MRAVWMIAVLVLLASVPWSASAGPAVTKGCQLVGHGALFGVSTGCFVKNHADQSVLAVVSVTSGTIDAIEIDIARGDDIHVFLCTFTVSTSVCAFPVRADVFPGEWTVTARIVAADPLGPFLFGGADTHARLDATFI